MQIEIRDITPEEAAPYGGPTSAVLAGRKTVVFTDADGNSGKLYMKEEEIDVLGQQYIAENSIMKYSELCDEWFPEVSWNAYKNDPARNPPKTIDVEFVCDMEGECTEIWRRLDTGGYLTRTSAPQTGRLSSQRRQSKSPVRASFSGRAERENCLRTRSKPAPDGACISTP